MIAIRPELLAGKLAKAATLERPELARQIEVHPRLVELLWFVQWRSFQPGGLEKLTEDLLTQSKPCFITPAMRKAGPAPAGKYSLTQCLTVWKSDWHDCGGYRLEYPNGLAERMDYRSWLDLHIDGNLTARDIERSQQDVKSKILAGFEEFNFSFLKANCEGAARERLPSFLRDLCIEESTGLTGPRYCPELIEAIFELMDNHAARAIAGLAETEVTSNVFDALDFAWAERKFIRIDGNSRFGKTESAKAWCGKYPGRVRLVTVPSSNAADDLVGAVAESLGMDSDFGISAPKLKKKIAFIVRHGGLGFVFDEAHFLWPARYGKNTAPSRLNWLRTEIVDRRRPCVLITTPQAYDEQGKRFGRATNYNMDQFSGRLARHVKLPECLAEKDLWAVVRVHLPTIGDREAKLIVGAAMRSESYVKAVEDIAALVRWSADGRDIGFNDVKDAVREVCPAIAGRLTNAPPLEKTEDEITPPPRTDCITSADTPRDHRPSRAEPVTIPA